MALDGTSHIMISFRPLSPRCKQMMAQEYGIGFPKGSELVPKVNGALAKIKADGRYTTIYKKWFGVEPPKK